MPAGDITDRIHLGLPTRAQYSSSDDPLSILTPEDANHASLEPRPMPTTHVSAAGPRHR